MLFKIIILAALFSLSVVATSAQKALFLKPHIGGQLPFGHSVGKSSTFKPRFLDTTDNLGLGLQLRLNEDWRVAAGWSQGNIGWGYIIEVPDRLVNPSYPVPRVKRVSGTYVQRFPLQVFHRLRDVIALPLRVGNKEFYLLNFSLHAFGGLSADYIGHASDFEEENEGKRGTPEGNSINYIEKKSVVNKWSASALAGVGMQFYYNGREGFELNLYISQGLRDMVQVNVDYTTNNEQHSARLLSRGSFIGATLAYPILLKTFKESSLPGK